MKNSNLLILITIMLAATTFTMLYRFKELKEELNRNNQNYHSAIYELKDSLNLVYNINKSELKEFYQKEAEGIKKDFDVKLKNILSIQNTNTVTHTNINTILRDTIIKDTIKMQYATYNDEWTNFRLEKINNNIKASIQTKDSLVFVLNKEKFYILKPFKKRNTLMDCKNYNPNSKIIYNRIIIIKK